MEKATIFFADNTKLLVKESDLIFPVIKNQNNTASIGTPVRLELHLSSGLIPSLMDVFVNYNFFYLNNTDYFTPLYCTSSIVKIVNE